jgi:tRNA (guanine10-N2)-dimethyltransferase
MYIAILGRQPEISLAELESLFGDKVAYISKHCASVDSEDDIDIDKLGGSLKIGHVIDRITASSWKDIDHYLINNYSQQLEDFTSKLTLGFSVYDLTVEPNEMLRTESQIKNNLKKLKLSVRLVPQLTSSLNTATSFHNGLGTKKNKKEVLIAGKFGKKDGIIIAECSGVQNIKQLTIRDRFRPKRDSFVGMLPPKLALIMVNLAMPSRNQGTVLDPFCGTGVVLQEASLLGFNLYGTDINQKMIDYTEENIRWILDKAGKTVNLKTAVADATKYNWKKPFDGIVSEIYLGQPFSTTPSSKKLSEVVKNCDHIARSFLVNISHQLSVGTRLCIALPAWQISNNHFVFLPVAKELESLGYKIVTFKLINSTDGLLYRREDQIVVRNIYILEKK